MPELKRDLVKYVRDKAKSKYAKGIKCEICNSTEKLDFHHYNSLSPLLHGWIKENNMPPEYIMAWREDFIKAHEKELYDDTVTLCHMHHLRLHSIYGKDPALSTAIKQRRWVEIQKEKHELD